MKTESNNESKSKINWYPGHMTKAFRQIEKNLDLCDAVAIVIDARIAISSVNAKIFSVIKNKPYFFIMNKCDLADDNVSSMMKKHFENQGIKTILTDSNKGIGTDKVFAVLSEVLAEKIARDKAKGLTKEHNLMICGVPNVGKSSLINRLVKSSKAKVENKAGITRSLTIYKTAKNVALIDTPGLLWEKIESATQSENLAFCGSINDNILDIEELACLFLDRILARYQKNIEDRYSVNVDLSEHLASFSTLEKIALSKNMKISGGELDTERAAKAVITDFRQGKLGKISLDFI